MTLLTEVITGQRLCLKLQWQDDTLLSLDIAWLHPSFLASLPPCSTTAWNPLLQETLCRYESGQAVTWPDLPLAWEAHTMTPWQRHVLTLLANTVPYGTVLSYGELGQRTGRPRAGRAVGGVMASNPWPILIPCHRVVGSTGLLTGFVGKERALALKAYLLTCEGHTLCGDGAQRRVTAASFLK